MLTYTHTQFEAKRLAIIVELFRTLVCVVFMFVFVPVVDCWLWDDLLYRLHYHFMSENFNKNNYSVGSCHQHGLSFYCWC